MQSAFLWFVLLTTGTLASGVEVTPVQKVVQLLQGMLEKGKNEKHAEQVQFASYKQFCDDTAVEKKRDGSGAMRPITIAATALRIGLSCVMRRHTAWVAAWLDPDLVCGPGKRAEEQHERVSQHIAQAGPGDAGGVAKYFIVGDKVDVQKCFDSL